MQQPQSNTRMIAGLIIVAIGVLFLLSNLDIIDYMIPGFIFKWQSILIIIGLIILGTSGNRSTGIVFILIGGIGLFPSFWPLLLVGLGLYIIFRTSNPGSKASSVVSETGQNSTQVEINDVAIFGGGKKYIHTDQFMGGKLTAIFGGSEIDLLDCKLAEGSHVLDIFAMFGGTTMLIPADWKIEIDLIPIFGGFSDNRRKDPNMVQRDDRVLRIRGLVIFGGGELKN